MNTDINTMLLASELHFREERIRKGVVRRNRLRELKKSAARKLS